MTEPLPVQLAILDGLVLPGCPHCGETIPEMEAMKVYVEGLERSMRGLRARNTLLQNEAAGASTAHPFYKDALEVYEHWKALLAPASKALSEPARKALYGRLKEGWSVEDLKTSVTGYAGRPYLVNYERRPTGMKDQRRVNLDLLLKDDDRVRRGIDYFNADREDRIRKAMPQDVITPEALGANELPPMNLRAEGEVLGYLINAGEHGPKIIKHLSEQGLRAEHFYRPLHQEIYEVMSNLELVTPTTVATAIGKARTDRTATESYVVSLPNQMTNPSYRVFAAMVIEAWLHRQHLNQGRELIAAALSEDNERMDVIVNEILTIRQEALGG